MANFNLYIKHDLYNNFEWGENDGRRQ